MVGFHYVILVNDQVMVTITVNCEFEEIEASRGAGTQNVTVKSTDCGFDSHSKK